MRRQGVGRGSQQSPWRQHRIRKHLRVSQNTHVNPPSANTGERREAKRVLSSQSESDDSEKEFILEYYSLVREGKTNYIATTAFHDVTGTHPTEPNDFFKNYSADFRPRKKAKH